MKKICVCLFAGVAMSLPLRAATEVKAQVPPGFETVAGNANLSFNLVVAGCDSVQAWANGAFLGQLRYPYTISFTSLPTGNNTVDVVSCNWNGQARTNRYNLLSASRSFRGRLRR